MLFNSVQFVAFFAVLLMMYWSAPRSARAPILLTASMIFYSLWIPVYLVLLLVEMSVNYLLLRAMIKSRHPKLYLVASIAFTLGLLAYFKYAALLIGSLAPVLESGMGWQLEVPDLFLPLGISFYSFQIISLSVDTYRGRIDLVDRFSRYALFVSFFPQLIAGPILRGHEFLPQLRHGGIATSERTRRGLWLIASGLVKKVILADFMLAPFVDEFYAMPDQLTAPFCLILIYSFAFQIYFDFSGYTDIARGLACLLGFELPLNFTEPYLSRDPAEFWRRWHITLSRWLRDYLFFPLASTRTGARRPYINLILTMLLGGLWHGASWTFLAWGGLHGLLLVLYRVFGSGGRSDNSPLRFRDTGRVLLFFHLTCLLLVFFRAETFEDAGSVFAGLCSLEWSGWPVLRAGVVFFCAGLHWVERRVRLNLPEIREWVSGIRFGSALEGFVFGCILTLAVAVSGSGGEFIYFQF